MYIYRVGEMKEPQKSFKRLVRTMMRFDIISFDIFDTTLIRLCESPQDIYKIMEEKADGIGVPNFAEKRIISAKAAAYEKKEKTSIDDIYSELALRYGVSQDKVELLKNLEVHTEISACLPNETIIRLIKELSKYGKKVIFTSDMYLHKSIIEKIFHSLCLEITYDNIYVSCDIGKTKAKGELFGYIAEKYPRKKLIHIGDNLKSDIIMAYKSKKFKAVYLPGPRAKYSMFDKFLKYSVSDNATGIERWAYEEFSPMLWDFCSWLDLKAKENDCRHLLFLTREGAFFKQLYDLFPSIDKCESHIFYASRRSLLCASSDINWKWVKRTFGSSTVEFLLEEFHINQSDVKNYEKGEKVKDWSDIESIKQRCAAYSRKQRDLLLGMLNDFLPLEGDIGIVDVGWKGSSQLFLQNIMKNAGRDVKLHGFYLGELYDERYEGLEKHGYMCSSSDSKYNEAVLNAGFIFENVLSPDIGTTVGYSLDGDTVVPVIDNTNVMKDKRVKIVQAAIKDYFHKMSGYSGYIEINRTDVLNRLFSHLNFPSYAMACDLGDIEWKDFEERRYVAKPKRIIEYMKNPKKFFDDMHYCGWNSAFCLRTFKIPLPYFTIYSKLRRKFMK